MLRKVTNKTFKSGDYLFVCKYVQKLRFCIKQSFLYNKVFTQSVHLLFFLVGTLNKDHFTKTYLDSKNFLVLID